MTEQEPIELTEHTVGGAADAPLLAFSLHHFQRAVGKHEELSAVCELRFQNGPPSEVGRNGFTNEEVLVAALHRLREFNKGEFSCKENSCAITKIEEALHWLQARTLKRLSRGVEGTLAA